MADNVFWQIAWVVLGVVLFAAGILAGRSRRALYVGRLAFATLFVVAGGLFNAINLATGGDYTDFADDSYMRFVRDTWASVVAPNQNVFISLLVAFEVIVGLLVLTGGRKTQLGLVGIIGFHLGLLCFGWVYYAWSIPMIFVATSLLRAQRKQEATRVEPHIEHRLAA